MKKILIKGYYGVKNLGDDMILYSILDSLNAQGEYLVYVITAGDDDYGYLFPKFPNLKCRIVPPGSWRKFNKLKLMMECDYWIIGGGGLWPGENPAGLEQTLKEIRTAKKFNTKICYYGIDINAISKPESKKLWKQLSDEADMMVCRNNRTTVMLEGIGCQNVVRSSDLTFGLQTEAEKKESRECLNKIGCEEGKYVIWACLMPWPKWEFKEEEHGERYCQLVNAPPVVPVNRKGHPMDGHMNKHDCLFSC